MRRTLHGLAAGRAAQPEVRKWGSTLQGLAVGRAAQRQVRMPRATLHAFSMGEPPSPESG